MVFPPAKIKRVKCKHCNKRMTGSNVCNECDKPLCSFCENDDPHGQKEKLQGFIDEITIPDDGHI